MRSHLTRRRGIIVLGGASVLAASVFLVERSQNSNTDSSKSAETWLRRLTGTRLSLDEPPRIVRARRPSDFVAVGIQGGHERDGFRLVRRPDGALIAVGTSCSFDGCGTNQGDRDARMICPCCGSRYDADGVQVGGPARGPLPRFKVYRESGSVLVNMSVRY